VNKVQWLAASVCALALVSSAHAQSPFPGESFAEAAAARGQAAFAQNCASCHGADLSAGPFGPALKGAAFETHWKGQPIGAVQAFMQTRMPPSAPNSLGAQTYGDIAAYILKANGAAPGKADAPVATTAAPTRESNSGRPPPTVPADDHAKAAIAARKARLDALSPVTEAALASPPDADWLMWRRTWQAHGFSGLKEIDKANVSGLRPAWSWTLPVSQNETTPLVHDGVMFVASGNAVQALDAATGERLWQYVRALPAALNDGRSSRAKSLALYGNKLFVPTADKHLVALDIHTGALVWDHDVVGDKGLTLSSGPIVAKGKVILGASLNVAGSPGGCFILALDAETGREAWRFNTIARPGQPGGDSWNGAPVDERFGAGVWTAGSYDPKLNLIFFGTGNTYDIATLLMPHAGKGESNDGLYTDSTLAIDADTGKLVWFYQHMNRDVWDQDWAFEQTLATLPVDGKPREVLFTSGKLGIFDVLDRATGQYLFSKDLGLQNLVVAIDPKTGHKTTNPALEPEPGKVRVVCPSTTGVRAWPATALDYSTPQSRGGVFVALSIPLGGGRGLVSGVQAGDGPSSAYAEVSSPGSPEPGSFAWRARAESGPQAGVEAEGDYRAAQGDIDVLVRDAGGVASIQARADGALVLMDRAVFAAPAIHQAFAVVEAGLPNVPILFENRPIGKSGADGLFLAPDLAADAANHISIDPDRLPADATVDSLRVVATPSTGSGVIVRFPVRQHPKGVLLTLTDAAGQLLPVASRGRAGPKALPFEVGYDGQAYVEDAAVGEVLDLILPEGRACRAVIQQVNDEFQATACR
jgi:alcohol dehydrogenase (cytochrome c)